MTKIYNFEQHKLKKELQELLEFLEERYFAENAYRLSWFDQSVVTNTKKRIADIHQRLDEISK